MGNRKRNPTYTSGNGEKNESKGQERGGLRHPKTPEEATSNKKRKIVIKSPASLILGEYRRPWGERGKERQGKRKKNVNIWTGESRLLEERLTRGKI